MAHMSSFFSVPQVSGEHLSLETKHWVPPGGSSRARTSDKSSFILYVVEMA